MAVCWQQSLLNSEKMMFSSLVLYAKTQKFNKGDRGTAIQYRIHSKIAHYKSLRIAYESSNFFQKKSSVIS